MSGIDKIKEPIAKELKIFERQFKKELKSDVFLLNTITQYVLKTKGKQIRPILVMLSARLFGDIGNKAHVAASMIELLHTATLVHDDVVDDANERRGAFSVFALWKSRTAVLLGDYLLARGLMLSVENEAFNLLRILSYAVQEMSEGELLQLQHSRKQKINQDDYFEIIRKKTATLIAACTASGADSSGATQQQVNMMHQFGIHLGMIFQIKDDLLDYQPNKLTGKPTGNDIKEKKQTLPLIYALNNAPEKEKKEILKLIYQPVFDSQKIKIISDFVTQKGGLAYCLHIMDDLRTKALGILDQFIPGPAVISLKELVDYTIDREK